MRPVALLVGIESYPHPSAALPGARHDVERMRACCVALGVADHDLRVLSGAVTKHELEQGLAWLAERLAEPGVSGLLHFAGHGRRVPQDWALVSSEGATLTMTDLRRHLAGAPERDLTLLFDACVDASLDLAGLLPDDAVLYLGTDATPELQLGRTRQGALSWALATVLERWTWEQGGPEANTAVIAAARLLDALQTGVDLRVSPKIRQAAFLTGKNGARAEPAPPVAHRQFDPTTGGYKTEDGQGNDIGWIFVPLIGNDDIYAMNSVPDNWTMNAPTPKSQITGNTYTRTSFTTAAKPFPQQPPAAKFWKGQVHNGAGNPIAGQVCFMVLPTGTWPQAPKWFCRPSMNLHNNMIKLGLNETIKFTKLGAAPGGNVKEAT